MKEWIYWLQQAWIFSRQKKSNSNENIIFLRKTDERIWKPPVFLRWPPLSTNPPLSEQFFHDPPLYPNFKNKNYILLLVILLLAKHANTLSESVVLISFLVTVFIFVFRHVNKTQEIQCHSYHALYAFICLYIIIINFAL